MYSNVALFLTRLELKQNKIPFNLTSNSVGKIAKGYPLF